MSVWSRKSRLGLIEGLEMYIGAGLAVDKSLNALSEGMPKSRRASLTRAENRISSGQTLASVMAIEVRPPGSVVGLISCGESSGSLAKTLRASHALLEREDELIKKCLSAMTYPIVIGVAAVILAIGLVRGIMPQIIPLLTGLHAKLPLLTVVVIEVSGFLTKFGIYILGGTTLTIVGSIYVYKKSRFIEKIIQTALIRVPIIGNLVRLYALSVLFTSLGSLIEAGMSVDLAFNQSVSGMSLIPMKEAFGSRSDSLNGGGKMSSICDRSMPPYVAPLITAGEASGNLGGSLLRAAALMDREMDHALKRLTALIEPLMMIVMGAVVGSIALSIMMPIYDISKTLQH